VTISNGGDVLATLPRPVAVTLGGGGVFGAAHVGAGYALERRGFVPDLIVGTSVGALNGAIAAAHPDRAASWLDLVWTRIHRREVFPLGLPYSRPSICSDRGLRRLFARAELPTRIDQLPIPFAAVAMDLATGSQAVLDRGDLESALLASSAIPGILPPVHRDGRTLVDGGVVAYVPVRAAVELGAASVVVVAGGPETWPVRPDIPRRRAGAIAVRAGLLRLHHHVESDLREVADQIPTVVLPTGVDTWPSPWSFGQSRRLIASTAIAAGRFLDQLEVDGPGLYRAGSRSDLPLGAVR
jgi:NTE family protein